MTNPYGQQPPQAPQRPPHRDTGRARALFGISTLFALMALFVTLAGNSGEKGIAGLLFIGFAIAAAVSYSAMNKK